MPQRVGGRPLAELLRVLNLVKEFPSARRGEVVHAVNDVSFEVGLGETLALVGESGSGKTTVGRCVARLTRATSGTMLFQGEDLSAKRGKDLRTLRAYIRVVFQDPYDSLDPRCSVGDALTEAVFAFPVPGEKVAWRVRELADQVEISQRVLGKYPGELSGGQLQAVGIARAMASRPRFIVLDEPTSLLDASARSVIVRLLARLQEETRVAYLFISHDLMTVREISDRVAIMYLGKVVECAPKEDVFERPQHPYTAALMSSILYADPNRPRAGLGLQGEIPSAVNLPSGCAMHSRCPIAIKQCRETTVRLVEVSETHSVACLRTATSPDYEVPEEDEIGVSQLAHVLRWSQSNTAATAPSEYRSETAESGR